MKIFEIKKLAALTAAVFLLGTGLPSGTGLTSFAATGNMTYATGVSEEMCSASYWYDKTAVNGDSLLMSRQEIQALNADIIAGQGTGVRDLCSNISDSYDADAIIASLTSAEVPSKDLYMNGSKIDKDTYFQKINNAIKNTGFTGTQNTRYAVASAIADLKGYPESTAVGYSPSDQDDEFESSTLCVNEPFAIRQKCEINGKTYYWGYTDNCSGWVEADKLALFSSKDEWISAWKVNPASQNFLVVTQDKIVLEKSMIDQATSGLTLNVGTVLKLVPESQIPKTIGGRGSWYNYVVYVPVRDANGNCRQAMALISKHYKVSIGYPDLTQKNLLDIAFSCLGNRYGWGGMLEALDCSAYTRHIYRCFGVIMPRNSSSQINVPGKAVDLSSLSASQKNEYIKGLPAGSILVFPGHVMMYIGTVNGTPYVISALGTTIDAAAKTTEITTVYSIAITPVTVKRGSGKTWLEALTRAVVLKGSGQEALSPAAMIYKDLAGYEYAEDAILYADSQGLLKGVGDGCFGPGTKMSRAMLLTVLARMDGQDTSTGSVWYEAGINWAIEKGISDGSSPETAITREQLAAMLYRYAGSPSMDNTEGDDTVTEAADSILDTFSDADQISDYAREAMQWAVSKGIITGLDASSIAPQAPAVRAQAAVMLQRYSKL